METKSCGTHTTTTHSTSASLYASDRAANILADRIRKKTGKQVINEIWFEKFMKEQERRRKSFQNKKSFDLQKRLRKTKKDLNDNTGTIEQHYKMRKHLQRQDSKVGKKLKNLIMRRKNCMAEIEKKCNVPQQTFVSCINEDGPVVEYKDGWIDLPQHNQPERQDSKVLKGKKRLSIKKIASKMQRSLSKSMDQMTIQEKNHMSSNELNERSLIHESKEKISPEYKCATQNDVDNNSPPPKSNSKPLLLNKEKSVKSFVKRKSLVQNERFDNGAFAIW